jgi:hypothetical protein
MFNIFESSWAEGFGDKKDIQLMAAISVVIKVGRDS